jgi:MYXO-CTERM domain-containing protein
MSLRALASIRALCLPLAGAAALAMPMGAHATTASSNFYGAGFGTLFDKAHDTFSTTVNGVGLSIQAVSSGSSPKVQVRWDGIGMSSSALEAGELNSGLFGTGDALLLTFSQDVQIHSLTLSGWDTVLGAAIDKASLTSKGVTHALSGAVTPFLSPLSTFALGQLPASRFYVLGAEGGLSSFRLAGLQVVAVPEASSWAMLALGLGGIALARRRSHGQQSLANALDGLVHRR